jgi:ribosome-associated translation inhibitor RaiA
MTSTPAALRIAVSGVGADIDGQTRAYAEYRLFSRLAGARDHVDHALIALRGGGEQGAARCAITITLRSGGLCTASARAQHIYDAIDQAVESAAKGVQHS